VVDNVNINKEKRKVFLDIAKKHNIKVRCLHFTTPKELCIHNAYYRNYILNNNVKPIPNLVFNIMNKKFQEPELSEGFYKIEKIEFFARSSDKYTKFFY
jgi:bifunctional polynucleotide phosphatase/kinase